jgi:hypothetical protein
VRVAKRARDVCLCELIGRSVVERVRWDTRGERSGLRCGDLLAPTINVDQVLQVHDITPLVGDMQVWCSMDVVRDALTRDSGEARCQCSP